MAKFDFKRPFMPAVFVTAALLVVNFVLSLLDYPVATLYTAVGPVSAVSGTLGHKVLGWVGGIIPIGNFFGTGLIAVFISAYAILLVGMYLVRDLNFWHSKGKVGQLVSEILWGTAVFYFIVVGFIMQAWGTYLGLLIHTIIVAYVASYAIDKLKF